jgi:hypothetical protein
VSAVLRAPALPPAAGAELTLLVPPNRTPGVFRLDRLAWGGSAQPPAYTLDGVVLKVAQPPAGAWELRLGYTLSLPPREDPLGYTPRQLNLCDWYPYLPPYRADRGWLVNQPGAVGEYTLPASADYRVTLTVPDPPANLTVAASTAADAPPPAASETPAAGVTYTYTQPGARSFSLSLSPEYAVQTQSGGGFDVSVYAFPEHAAAARASAQASLQALAIYTRLFAPYPRAHLAVVESLFRDGMEYDGLYFLGWEYFQSFDGSPQNYLTALSAHETAHQWWYAQVGSDPAGEPWLDEALATYSELLYYENTQADLRDWWWDFRVYRFDPGGAVNSPTSAFSSFRPYVNAVYLRGALYLRDLRGLLGDDRFFAALRAYAAAGRGQWMTAADFFGQIAGYSDPKFAPLKSEYFR